MALARARFRGALLGCMLGDSLGRPLEMMSTGDSRLRATLVQVLDSSHTLHYSDDTQMMISVAESLVRVGGVSREDLLATLAANYDAARGYGHGMRAAIEVVRTGRRPTPLASWSEGSKGNGGAVRVVPIACAFHDDLDLVATLAEDATGLTHAHPLGRAGGVAHAVATACMLAQDDQVDAASLLSAVGQQRAVRDTSLASKFEEVLTLVERRADAADAARVLGNGALAEEAVPLALFAFLRWAPDFASVVTNTILAGGDTDTTAAMSGALCGALVGEADLPAAWLARMEGGAKGLDHVCALADAVFDLWTRRAHG
jgi:poly(ADP-ribose) glycohydrolase ARH3